ncbi:hypothetical protein FACS1894184_04750 [Clostridia bacterium]|nr:hypothetical protein FACS1894184_04750 [Clostridia bacterium]
MQTAAAQGIEHMKIGHKPSIVDYNNDQTGATAQLRKVKTNDGERWRLIVSKFTGDRPSFQMDFDTRTAAEIFLTRSASVQLRTGRGGIWCISGYPKE